MLPKSSGLWTGLNHCFIHIIVSSLSWYCCRMWKKKSMTCQLPFIECIMCLCGHALRDTRWNDFVCACEISVGYLSLLSMYRSVLLIFKRERKSNKSKVEQKRRIKRNREREIGLPPALIHILFSVVIPEADSEKLWHLFNKLSAQSASIC